MDWKTAVVTAAQMRVQRSRAEHAEADLACGDPVSVPARSQSRVVASSMSGSRAFDPETMAWPKLNRGQK